MAQNIDSVLIIGSAPNAVSAAGFDADQFDCIVAINNAWRVRPDWNVLIHPEDFPEDRRPTALGASQRIVTAADYVPVQNDLGGFVYAGGTMAFTAGYWALGALKPSVIGFMGCDMVYPSAGRSHFYGTGTADPLRDDVTLRSLEAKSARMALMAARQGCAMVNFSDGDSRLMFDRANPAQARGVQPVPKSWAFEAIQAPLSREAELGYMVPSGRYWREEQRFEVEKIDALDALWLQAFERAMAPVTV